MRWIVDTSAWSRRRVPGIKDQLQAVLDEEAGSEFVLSPSVLLELLRGPQGKEVGEERQRLTLVMETLKVKDSTLPLAADAMQQLALHGAEAHRLPLADLITAALAQEHACGVLHVDADFESLTDHSGLEFEHRRLELPDEDSEGGADNPAARQRALKQELFQLLHQRPLQEAEAILEDFVEELRG